MLSSPPRLPQSRSPASDAQAPRTAALSHFLCAALGARKLFPLRTENNCGHTNTPTCAEKGDHSVHT